MERVDKKEASSEVKALGWDIMPIGGAMLEVAALIADSNHGSLSASCSLSLIHCPPTLWGTWSVRCLVRC